MDPPFQKGALSPTKLAELLHLPESEQDLLRKTEEDFYNESLEVGCVMAEVLGQDHRERAGPCLVVRI